MAINAKRVAQHFRNFERALDGYAYNEPLSRYLTRFFKENKQMGSSDRRMTSRFIYNYFRLGTAIKEYTILDRLCYAEFLCQNSSDILTIHYPELVDKLDFSLEDKIVLLQSKINFKLEDVFPFYELISPSIESNKFIRSHFVQPDMFIRIKRGDENIVLSALQEKEVGYTCINSNTVALPNGIRLQDFPKITGKYEVQDLSSQKTINFMSAKNGETWWDACAASGGKSLMLLDQYPTMNILVSDIRLSILRNLNDRFDNAKVKIPQRQKILDLTTDTTIILGNEQFDGVILDVPCSGSGTWGRTPEMIQQFSRQKLNEFTDLQRRIVSNILKHVKVGKPLVYITCSVYIEENEKIIDYIINNFDFQIEKMEVIKGYENKADSMFAARLVRIS
ncbi:RsmB/NOP family class I SAM-dependent RNA methyltransferase [Sphingobacterium bovistauri]|uniref:RsmB/NOP family class I SAM-dependent RNA methyltransferase n=1 Tax=Sphingobacterium bovistauri TaxID=2781959 RepID=A0ABS7Z3X6_9SPHI|nr:RsmB/NOP family class I SAM-dependent RNA methyltransferase [Sphingobacterium bovistauri]MCA5004881.1 RsmB/NOP family class I SAM-dependent RNA methyltransferase [Sphingobacterium bovistauri]